MPARPSMPAAAPVSTTLPSQRKRAAWQGADAELNYNSEIVRVRGLWGAVLSYDHEVAGVRGLVGRDGEV